MVPVQCLDIARAVESAIHDQLNLLIVKEVKFVNQFLNGFDIGDIPGHFPIIERQPAFFSEKESQIDLGQAFAVLVPAIFQLAERFGIARDGRAVISPVLFLSAPLSLETEEAHLCLFRNGLEHLRAPLGGDVLSVWVAVQPAPFWESEQRVLVFQNQVVSNGLDLFIRVWEAGFQIRCDAGFDSDLVEEVGSPEEEAGCLRCRDRPPLGVGCCGCLASLPAAICRNYFASFRVETPDQGPSGPGLFLLLVPVRC